MRPVSLIAKTPLPLCTTCGDDAGSQRAHCAGHPEPTIHNARYTWLTRDVSHARRAKVVRDETVPFSRLELLNSRPGCGWVILLSGYTLAIEFCCLEMAKKGDPLTVDHIAEPQLQVGRGSTIIIDAEGEPGPSSRVLYCVCHKNILPSCSRHHLSRNQYRKSTLSETHS